MATKPLQSPDSANGQPAPERNRLQAVAGYFADTQSGDADRLIYEKIRLGILSALSVEPVMSFTELRELLQTSDGNLSAHARKLETAGYIECEKTFDKRVPKSVYRMTSKGRRVFARHLAHMEALIRAAQGT
ncbi:MAG: transcriptional regulator [Gammaproteobacteria bacterium]|jgi:DNA-binding MarR family transcriptional regulator